MCGVLLEELTWFWMRSLTRSLGAAAVFETAAETPPTDKLLVSVTDAENCRWCSHHARMPIALVLMELSMVMERTQEVDHEALI